MPRIAPADFSTNFVVTIEYSDNPQLTASNVNASYTTVSASSSPTLWASPNYQLDLALTVNVDNQLVIQGSSSGTVTLEWGHRDGHGLLHRHGCPARRHHQPHLCGPRRWLSGGGHEHPAFAFHPRSVRPRAPGHSQLDHLPHRCHTAARLGLQYRLLPSIPDFVHPASIKVPQ